MPSWRMVAALVAISGYSLLSYALMTYAPGHAGTVLTLFGPLLVALTVGGLLRRHWPTVLASAALAAGVLVLVRSESIDVQHLYVLQHAAINASLAWTFGITLRPGSTPLISMMAERVHQGLTPAMRVYTTWLTGAWAVFFIAMVVVSLAIYTWLPWAWWSFFCNVLTPLAVGAFFVIEYVQRYRRHPEFERATMAQAVRAFRTATVARPQGR